MIRILTDTSANLPPELVKKYGIEVLPFTYNYNNSDLKPKDDFDGKSFYDAMRAGSPVTTALINVGTYIDCFEKHLAAGDDVINICMSGGISGSANSAATAVSDVAEQYPERRIISIDTYAASLGEGMQALVAAQMNERGASFDEIVDKMYEMREKMCQYFTVDDLQYLRRGGRISGASALIGTMLNIKPILQGDETGHIIMCDKARGMKHALKALAEKYDKLCADKSAPLGIAHADNPEGLEMLVKLLRERGFTGEPINVMYEPVTGSHVGPGTVALFFPGIHK